MDYKFKVEKSGQRIDKYLSQHLDYSRSIIQKIIDQGHVLVNGQAIKSSYKVNIDDLVVFSYIEEEFILEEKKMDLEIVYEDTDILVINKAKNTIVHPANKDQQDTLVNGLIYAYPKLKDLDPVRPGIVHRLDKDTSGALLVAKNKEAEKKLIDQFSKGSVIRKYLALVHGRLNKEIIIDKKIGRNEKDRIKMAVNEKNGKRAISIVRPIESFGKFSLLEVELKTGRTHQIRVHLASIGYPVVGDLVYGRQNSYGIQSQMLHSYYLEFVHPIAGNLVKIKTDQPSYMKDFIERIKNEENFKPR
ncbi:MAG: RluA family pseudouridine synthase [Bacillota bacterium]|nr:RluA family pseudouridine synthase [Bacillota bacterium]